MNPELLSPQNKQEYPLKTVEQIVEGQPASIVVYHGSQKFLTSAVPSEQFPVVFYSDSKEVAASYPFGKYLNQLLEAKEYLIARNPKYSEADLVIGLKLLITEDLKKMNSLGMSFIDFRRFSDDSMNKPNILAIKEKMESDPDFKSELERIFNLDQKEWELKRMKKDEVVDYENGPLGSVDEYIVDAQNPAVIDFEGHTWGDMKDENGQWTKPGKNATTEQLRQEWNAFIQGFFAKGHDVLIVKNIIDVGAHFVDGQTKPHNVIAVSTKAKVEPKSGNQTSSML